MEEIDEEEWRKGGNETHIHSIEEKSKANAHTKKGQTQGRS